MPNRRYRTRCMVENAIYSRFGTWRGLIRLVLSYGQVAMAGDTLPPYDENAVTRLVFVCHGNICRSAYGDMLARKLGARAVSFGLSTSTGLAAHPPIAAYAKAHGLSAEEHTTSQRADIDPQPGDLLLPMEFRQAAALKNDDRWGKTPRALLGQFASPPVPHLHDPYTLSQAYMKTCLQRIERSVMGVIAAHPGVMCG